MPTVREIIQAAHGRQKPTKYKSRKAWLDGILFDSKAEANRYAKLAVMQKAGFITDLKTHPLFKITVNGHNICSVELDFSYINTATGKLIYEDVKGKQTALSAIKKKLVEAVHAIDVDIIREK